jgi:hypothetical protein
MRRTIMSNKLFYLICLALVLALAGFAQAELLVNPDFESGLDSWKTWGGGSGSGAGGWFSMDDTHATVMEDGTAHGGNTYVEAGIADAGQEEVWWAVMLVFQEHPVTEGQTFQMSAWFRDGDADGAPSLIANGGMLQWEWRDAAPVGDPNTDDRGEMVERITHNFDLTEEWTNVSATEVVPPGAKGLTVIFGSTWGGINLDIDDVSFVEVVPSFYVLSTDQEGGLVPIINRDFSEPNDGKHTAFDIETSRKQDEPFLGFMTTDVPGWTTDVSAKDSGIEDGGGEYGYSAFLMGGYSEWDDDPNWIEPSVWQILPYKIQEGDQFRLTVDAVHVWTVEGVPVELKMALFYVDINGSRQELASQIVDLTEAWEWGTYVLDVPELNEMAVGKLLGIELQNIAIRSSWIHVDNVSLIGE